MTQQQLWSRHLLKQQKHLEQLEQRQQQQQEPQVAAASV
jgi:hypothetical protein